MSGLMRKYSCGILIRVSPEMHEEMKILSDKSERSVTQLVRLWIKQGLKKGEEGL